MDACEAYGNGDDVCAPATTDSESESESEDSGHNGCGSQHQERAWRGFSKHQGNLMRGSDLLVATITVMDAMKKAQELLHCVGFCFRGEVGDDPVEVFFKCKWDFWGSSRPDWTCFRKDRPFKPDDIVLLKDWQGLAAGQDGYVLGETSCGMYWMVAFSDATIGSRDLPKSSHAEIWLEHDGLPFQVRMFKTRDGFNACQAQWVVGETGNGQGLLLDNGRTTSGSHAAWEEVGVMDMCHADKVAWLADIKAAGSTLLWRRALADAQVVARGRSASSSDRRSGVPDRGTFQTHQTRTSTHGGNIRMFCSQCAVAKPAEAFSKTQRKRAVAFRRCTACVTGRAW